MVEVFKTNVTKEEPAEELIQAIHSNFRHYEANFDLEDRDNILRIESLYNVICLQSIMELVAEKGYQAEALQD